MIDSVVSHSYNEIGEFISFGPCSGLVWHEPPRPDKFLRWLSVFKHYICSRNIPVSVYLAGTFLESPDTASDVDIILTRKDFNDHDHAYKLRLRDAMIFGMKEGLKMHMHVDIDFYIPFKDDGTFWYSSSEYKRTGKTIDVRGLMVFDKFMVNGVVVDDYNDKDVATYCKQIDVCLYEIGSTSPGDKHIDKIVRGDLYDAPKLLFQSNPI